MNFTKKSMKYAVTIFTVFAISGLLYTSSITQYGFAQNNSSSNSGSSGSGSQGNSSSGGSSSGQKNDIGTAAELHNLTGAGTQKILSNNSKISNSGGLSKLGNESSMDKPNMTKGNHPANLFQLKVKLQDNLVISINRTKCWTKPKPIF